jgi:hypothetical protein
MEPNGLGPPDPVELVPAASAHATITNTTRDLAQLRREADLARLAAYAAEGRAAEAGVDGQSATWALVHMQRLLDELRADVERDVQTLRDLAKDRARVRLDQARAEAAHIRGGSSPIAVGAPGVPAPAPIETPTKDPSPDSYRWPPVSRVVHVDLVSEAGSGEAPREARSISRADVATVRPPLPASGTRWVEPPPRRKRGTWRRVPLSAVLEVLVVVLIVMFVLWRLS